MRAPSTFASSVLAYALLLALPARLALAEQQPPRFTSSTEVTSMDVTVVDNRGRPVTGLQPSDFTVRVDDIPRRVITADWVPLVGGETTPPEPPPEGYSTNEVGSSGRLVVIVIDQPNIATSGTAHIQRSVGAFLDRLQPADRVSAIGIGPGIDSTPFTADRELVKRAISRMAGQKAKLSNENFNITLSEALDVYDPGREYAGTLPKVIDRECEGLDPGQLRVCALSVRNTAVAYAMQVLADGRETLRTLRSILNSLRGINAPKTLILVSEGFVLGEELPALTELGPLASEARTSIYTLKLAEVADASRMFSPSSLRIQDGLVTAQGLEVLANVTGGSLFDVSASAEVILERIEAEISGYYLVGIESEPSDRDGRSHELEIDVERRGAIVRSRRELHVAAPPPRSPRAAAMAALGSPLLQTALPLRVSAFSLQGSDPSKVQLLIHAEVGRGYSSPAPVSLAYVIADANDRIVESQTAAGRLSPIMSGVPSALQFVAGASLPPGVYKLKLAAAEGDRSGSVEHPIRAGLVAAGPINLSELFVGGPVDGGRAALRPTVAPTVHFGVVHGYVEAYGAGVDRLVMRYEIAARADGPAILEAETAGQPAGPERAIFTQMLPVRQLPPGAYTLRALLASGEAAAPDAPPVKVMTRAFTIAPPPVLMTSAENPGATVAPADVFLPVPEAWFERPFHREDASRPDTVRTFRERVDPSARTAFDDGVGHLTSGDYVRAEESFKSVIQVQTESTGPLAYLGATFAASGHDLEAAGAWQTALIEGSDLSQIYLWLGDTLLRTRDLSQARNILEEATAKWPDDARFAKPMALVYATFGRGRDAVRTLQRHIEANPNDLDVLRLAIEWIYHLHSSGIAAGTRADDIKLARAYGETYEKLRGPQLPLVREWIQYLERGGP